MKVEYNLEDKGVREPVAFFDEDEDLVLLNPDGEGGWLLADGGTVFTLSEDDVITSIHHATRMLYRGDKVTITF